MSRQSRQLRRIRRDARATRRMVTRQTAYIAQASFTERAAWDQQRAIEYDRWMWEQANRDAPPGWYPDPATLRQCHTCGAPRDGLPMDAACGYCSATQRWRYFDGSNWSEHLQPGRA